jgi:hypothetical protein
MKPARSYNYQWPYSQLKAQQVLRVGLLLLSDFLGNCCSALTSLVTFLGNLQLAEWAAG